MEEIIKIIQEIGIYGCIMGVILFLGLKYLPKFLEMKLKRAEEKDYISYRKQLTSNKK